MTETPENWTNWDKDTPPTKGAYLAADGWRIPLKGTAPSKELSELIVAIKDDGAVDVDLADIVLVEFDSDTYIAGDTIQVNVHYNELVDVTTGATLDLTTTGTSSTIELTAVEQTGVNIVEFTGTIPTETGDITIGAQTITGTIADSSDATSSDLTISAGNVTDAGTISIVLAEVTDVQFDEAAYAQADPITVTVTYDEEVSISAAGEITISSTGASGAFVLTAAAQTGTAIDFTGTVPSEAGTLSIGTQEIAATVVTVADGEPVDLTVSSALGTAAGTRVIS